MFEAWPALVHQAWREIRAGAGFRRPELHLVLDAMNGTQLLGPLLGQHLVANVEDAIRLNAAAEKWDVDPDALKDKLRRLGSFERAAMELWCRAFRASEKLNDQEWERVHLGVLVTAAAPGEG